MNVKRIVFATQNQGKLRELSSMFAGMAIDLRSLTDYPGIPEIIEDGSTFFENALVKARLVSEHTGEVAVADDSGLEVDYLGGKPGIYSARYAGPQADDRENNQKLLQELRNVSPERRGAAFRCVLVIYYPDGRYESFEGELRGRIIVSPRGEGGFGYDPLFFVAGFEKTTAELSPAEKNRISHRGQAFQKLKKYLQKIQEHER